MGYLLIVVTAFAMTLQNVFQKQYNIKTKQPNVFLYASMLAFFAMLFFVGCSKLQLSFAIGLTPYAALYAVFYAMTWVGFICAVRTGLLALTSLVISYSLVIPTLYGIFFLRDELKLIGILGIALLLFSILLLRGKDENTKIDPKWIVFAAMAFFGNGICSTVQKIQQLKFEGGYKNEFMILSLIGTSVILLIPAVISEIRTKYEENARLQNLKMCVEYGFLTGLANGGVNLLVMVLTGLVPTAILFPSISAMGIVFSFVISVFIYKERLSKTQIIGYAMGIVSVILLNI